MLNKLCFQQTWIQIITDGSKHRGVQISEGSSQQLTDEKIAHSGDEGSHVHRYAIAIDFVYIIE